MTTIIKQAETFRRVLQLQDVETGSTVDLTGCTAHSQMRTAPGGELLGDAACYIDRELGTVSALWSAEQTAEWSVGKCGYDIWLVCDGEQKPLYTETCEVIEAYTEIGG